MNQKQLLAALEAALKNKDQSTLEELGRKAVENFPEDAFGYSYLAEALLLMDVVKYHNIEILLAKAIQLDDDNIDYRLRFAYTKEMQDMFDDATVLYNQVLDKEPSNKTALKNLGAIELYITSNHQTALSFFNQALETDPSDEDLWAMKTEVLVALEQFEEALAAANSGLANGFNVSNASAKLIVLNYMGKNDGAEELYLKLFETDPDNFSLRFNYGNLLLNEKRYADAETQLNKALDMMDDGDTILMSKIAQAKLNQGNFQEAIELYNTCIERNSNDADLYALRADAKFSNKNFQEALDDLDSAISITGDDPLMVGTFKLKQGLVHYDHGDVNKSKSIMKELASNGMTRTLGYYGIGVIMHKEGDYEKSYTLLKLAKQMFSEDASNYIEEHLSEYLDQKKNTILKNQEGEIAKNAKSNLLNQLSGKLWKFKDLNSRKVDALDQEVQDQVKKSLSVLSIVFTERGVVLVNQGEGEILTYKLNKESNNQASAKFMVLDGDTSYDVDLKFNNGQFSFSKEDNEWIILEEQDLKTIPNNLKQNFKQVIPKDSTKFLGSKATPVIQAIY
ncbi:MAG: tetratricopeptide repeat protein [Saprospiraceae bacterium]|nr:tetratricopeptide repeat protein [Saprospiraceae bacterium]